MVKAIVGANWGDEGKGKITDMLAKETILELQEAKQQKESVCSMYFSAINKVTDEKAELLKEVARLEYKLEIINKPWYKKLFEGWR